MYIPIAVTLADVTQSNSRKELGSTDPPRVKAIKELAAI